MAAVPRECGATRGSAFPRERGYHPAGLADKFHLDQTIWASFANARHAEQRRQAREQELAA